MTDQMIICKWELRHQRNLEKTVKTQPKTIDQVRLFLFHVRIFGIINISTCKNSLIIWLFQKKYRILHFVKKRKPKLCGNRENRIYQTSVITI